MLGEGCRGQTQALNVCSAPPDLGEWPAAGGAVRSFASLSHQMPRPFFCESISSGWRTRKSRMNCVVSDSYCVYPKNLRRNFTVPDSFKAILLLAVFQRQPFQV